MKRILIVNNNMHIGGVQQSLINLLTCMCKEYEITLLLFSPRGELMSQIPNQVRVLTVTSGYQYLGMTKEDVAENRWLKFKRSVWAAITRIAGRNVAISMMARGQKSAGKYDVAISFLHDAADKVFYGGCNDFVLQHTEANQIITFLHCDYSRCGANTENNKKKLAQFDVIAACSEGCRRSFLKAVPELSNKTVVVPNTHNFNRIKELASADPQILPENRINILTVARLGKEKGVTRAIQAISQIQDCKFHYYVIGDGIEKTEVEKLISEHKLNHRVTLLGELSNPYGYISVADLLLIPSRSEAAPMVIGEAAFLGTPILSTETSSAEEMIVDTGYGWVCKNDIDDLSMYLRMLLTGSEKLKQKKAELRMKDFVNDDAINRISQILN